MKSGEYSHELQNITVQFRSARLSPYQDLSHAPTDVGAETNSGDLKDLIASNGYYGPNISSKFADGIIPAYDSGAGSLGISLQQNDNPGAPMHTFAYGSAPVGYPYLDANLISPAIGPDIGSFKYLQGADPIKDALDQGNYSNPIGTGGLITPGVKRGVIGSGGQRVMATSDEVSSYVEAKGFEGPEPLTVQKGSLMANPPSIENYKDAVDYGVNYVTSNVWYSPEIIRNIRYYAYMQGPNRSLSAFTQGNLLQVNMAEGENAICKAYTSNVLNVLKAGGARIDPAKWIFTMPVIIRRTLNSFSDGGDVSWGNLVNPTPDPGDFDIDNAGNQVEIEIDDPGYPRVGSPSDVSSSLDSQGINCGWELDISYGSNRSGSVSGVDGFTSAIEIYAGALNNGIFFDPKDPDATAGFIVVVTPGLPPQIIYATKTTPVSPLYNQRSQYGAREAYWMMQIKRGVSANSLAGSSVTVSVDTMADTMVVRVQQQGSDNPTVAVIAPQMGVTVGWADVEGTLQHSWARLYPDILMTLRTISAKFGWKPRVYKSWDPAQGMFMTKPIQLSSNYDIDSSGRVIIHPHYAESNVIDTNSGANIRPVAFGYKNPIAMQMSNGSILDPVSQNKIANEFGATIPMPTPADVITDPRGRLACNIITPQDADWSAEAMFGGSQNQTDGFGNSFISNVEFRGAGGTGNRVQDIEAGQLISDQQAVDTYVYQPIEKRRMFGSLAGLASSYLLDQVKKPFPALIVWADAWANSQVAHVWPNAHVAEWVITRSNFEDRNIPQVDTDIITTERDNIKSFDITAQLDGLIITKTMSLTMINPSASTLQFINKNKSTNSGYINFKAPTKDGSYIKFQGFIKKYSIQHQNTGIHINLEIQDPFSFLMDSNQTQYPSSHSVNGWLPWYAVPYVVLRTGLIMDRTFSDMMRAWTSGNFVKTRIGRYIATDLKGGSVNFGNTLTENLTKAFGPFLYTHYPVLYWNEETKTVSATTLNYTIGNASRMSSGIEDPINKRAQHGSTFNFRFSPSDIKFITFIKTQDRFRGSPLWTSIPFGLSAPGDGTDYYTSPQFKEAGGWKSSSILDATQFAAITEYISTLRGSLIADYPTGYVKPNGDMHIYGLPYNTIPGVPFQGGKNIVGLYGIGLQPPKWFWPGNNSYSQGQFATKYLYCNQVVMKYDADEGNIIKSDVSYQTIQHPSIAVALPGGGGGGGLGSSGI